MHVNRDSSADTDAYRDENAYPSARHSYSDQVANEHPHARRDADADPLTDADLHFDDYANAHLNAEPDTIHHSYCHTNGDGHRPCCNWNAHADSHPISGYHDTGMPD